MRSRVLSSLLTAISRMLVRRDRLSGAMERVLNSFPFDKERIVIPSGDRKLSSVYVSAADDSPAILICHGIGELVEYWGQVQRVLRERGSPHWCSTTPVMVRVRAKYALQIAKTM
jgi:uncharacterized protein